MWTPSLSTDAVNLFIRYVINIVLSDSSLKLGFEKSFSPVELGIPQYNKRDFLLVPTSFFTGENNGANNGILEENFPWKPNLRLKFKSGL